jgi:hypothetical protein
MGQPVFATSLIGAVNGVNTTFFTPTPYVAGTLAAFVNGQLKTKTADDGWTETNPATGEFVYTDAPRTNDKPAAFYIDTGPDAIVLVEVESILGSIDDITPISGAIRTADPLAGSLVISDDLIGTLAQPHKLVGSFEEPVQLTGVLIP